MTSKNIMQIHTFDDSIFYKTACDCCGDHEMTIEMEHDLNTIYLHLYSIVGHKNKKGKNFLKTFWNRILDATRIIIAGEIKSEEEFIMGSVDQINSFIKALEEGRNKLLLDMEKVKNEKN